MPRPLRVAHLIDRAAATEYFRSIARHHDRNRFRLWIGSLESEGALQRVMRAADTGTFSLGRRGGRWAWLAVPRLARWLRSHRIELLHLHTFYVSVVGLVAGRLAGVPAVVTTRHHSDHLLRLNRPLHHLLDRWVGRSVDRTIAVSRATKEIMVQEGADPETIDVVYNGIEPIAPSDGFDPGALREALALGEGPVAVTVARLHEEKGHRFALAALSAILERFPGFTLLLAGEGAEEEPLREQVRERGLEEAVRFLGYRSDVYDVVSLADVMIHPALAESFGFVLVEAMALGTPPLAADTGGVSEVVADGETGLVVPPEDPEALAAAALRLLADDELRERFAAAGRARVRERFTARAMVRGYETVYDAVLGDERRRHPVTVSDP